MKVLARFLLRFAIGVVAFVLFLMFLSWLAAPTLGTKPPDPPPADELAAMIKSRNGRPERDIPKRPRIQKNVDYGEGENAQWWPKHESPILVLERGPDGRATKRITVDGTPLPPVHERTGSEPLVLVGVEDQGRTTPIDPATRYGGTQVISGDIKVLNNHGSACNLVRWSPQGDPVVPHVAKAYEIGLPDDVKALWLPGMSDEAKAAWAEPRNKYAAFVFHLRNGMKWSDGKPYSAVDMAYWWWHETNNALLGVLRPFMRCAGIPGRVWLFEIDRETGQERPFYAKLGVPIPEAVEHIVVSTGGPVDRKLAVIRVNTMGPEPREGVLVNPYRFMVTFTRPKLDSEVANFDHLAPPRLSDELPNPNGLFIRRLATPWAATIGLSPAHYLWRFNPSPGVGDPVTMEAERKRRKIDSDVMLYEMLKDAHNPECPRIWPWINREHKVEPPHNACRNPYFWAVDEWGNQLPYLDRIHYMQKTRDMLINSIEAGEFPVIGASVREHMYEQIMSQYKAGGYRVLHWYRADRSLNTICFNLFKRVDPKRPETKWKRETLRDLRFRRAMSLAIDRQPVCDAEFYGLTEPAQCAPGPSSRFYYEHEAPMDPDDPYLREAYRSYIAYDPKRANELLDEMGLTKRDVTGFRTFPDGTTMTFFVDTYKGASMGPLRLMCRYWEAVGVRVIPKIQAGALYWTRKDGLQHDMTMFPGEVEYEAILQPRMFVPTTDESNYAIPFARWYAKGGLQGKVDMSKVKGDGIAEPPTDPAAPLYPLRRAMEIYDEIQSTGDPREQERLFVKIQDIAARNLWCIAPCTTPPVPILVRHDFHNVPPLGVTSFTLYGNRAIETYYMDKPTGPKPGMSERERKVADERLETWEDYRRKVEPEIRQSISVMIPVTPIESKGAGGQTAAKAGRKVGRLVRWLLTGMLALFVAMGCVRHPYMVRRLIIMIPTLFVISVIVFTTIQLPPGDFLTSMIIKHRSAGEEADLAKVETMRKMFHLDKPMVVRYARWLGLKWFTTFKQEDTGMLQGNLGRRMLDGRLVTDIVGDRILMTFLISLGTILVTWAIAIPLGMYSAMRQYSPGDYVLTLFGFIGMCIPSFLFAILIQAMCLKAFDMDISGLLSAEYSAQKAWDWPKVLDLLKHIWVPIVILTLTGTAGMIRVMRGNLLDELKKPYVIAARARGVRPIRLLLKYPLRLALNPFISGIGGILPRLISGGTIVAVVLSLPTVGQLLLNALMDQEMYIGGSMLLILSLLGVIGILISDLLLLWLDPRIRYEKGTR